MSPSRVESELPFHFSNLSENPAMNSKKSVVAKCFPILLASGLSTLSLAQESALTINKDDPNQVFAYQGEAVLTQQELDAAFMKIPESSRLVFIRDGARVEQLVQSLLEIKMLKNDAIEKGLADDPLVNLAVAMAADKELAQLWSQRIPSLAPAADLEALAREDYLANPSRYDKSASVDITQILLGTETRSLAEAEKLAQDLKNQLNQNPEKFQKMVAEYSDDPAKITEFGQIKKVTRGQMVPAFEQAAFALQEAGEISEPVTTQFGVHLIRLDARHSAGVPKFEDVREEAIARQEQTLQEAFLRKYLSQLFSQPAVIPEGAVEVMVKRHFGEDLEKAPVYSEPVDD